MKKGLTQKRILASFILLPAMVLLFSASSLTGSQDSHNGSGSDIALVQQSAGTGHQSNMFPLLFLVLSLITGAATRHFMKKSPLPYTVTLLLIGLASGAANRFGWFGTWDLGGLSLNMDFVHRSMDWAATIDPHLILYVFLPTLVFEAAYNMDVHTFRKTAGNAAILAIPGIIVALVLTAAIVIGMNATGLGFAQWGWPMALLFGTVVSATDPVAVVALLRELGASKKLGTLIEGESLLNDGTAIVIFSVLLLFITGGEGSTGPVIEFLRVSAGGILVGTIFGWVTIRWVGRVFNDAMIEISLIVAAAYLTFFVAEHFLHVSGVLGLVSLGLIVGGIGRTRISPEVGHFLHEFWELAAFIANTLIFLIVGVVIANNATFSGMDVIRLLIIYIGVHIVRALVIIIFFPVMKRIGYGLPRRDAVVLWYGALRGAVGLALALMVAGEAGIVQSIRDDFLFYTAGIVTLTLLVNATTIRYLLHVLGLTRIAPAKALMIARARSHLRVEAEKTLEDLQRNRNIRRADWDQVREYLPEEPPEGSGVDMKLDSRIAEMRRRLLEQEKSTYWSLFDRGLLGAAAVRRLTDAINVIIDEGGLVSLSKRKDLEQDWKTPRILDFLQRMPVVGKLAKNFFFERLATSYDSASAFVYAQEESRELLKELAEGSGDETEAMDPESVEMIEGEIDENKIQGQTFLRLLRNYYPEIYISIATRQAARVMLNHEQHTVKLLLGKGMIDSGEAEKITAGIEEQMKVLMHSHPPMRIPGAADILKEISWLNGLAPDTLNKIVQRFQSRVYAVKDTLIREQSREGGLLVLARGKVKIVISDTEVEVLGAGSVLGEMALLTGQPRTATVVAVTPVTVLWMSTSKMKSVMKEDPELENRLWKFACMRFAMNMLRNSEPYNQWARKDFIQWLSTGEVIRSGMIGRIDPGESLGILVSGAARSEMDGSVLAAPGILGEGNYTFDDESVVFKVLLPTT